jgi:hypothetical protein
MHGAGGGGASGLGVGSQECTAEELSALQTEFVVDPVGKAINRPIPQCNTDLQNQRTSMQAHKGHNYNLPAHA